MWEAVDPRVGKISCSEKALPMQHSGAEIHWTISSPLRLESDTTEMTLTQHFPVLPSMGKGLDWIAAYKNKG